MEDENMDQSQSSMSNTSNTSSFKETMKSGSPDDVKEKVKDVVEKGVAAVAGALKGFNRGTEKNRLPEETKNAIHQAAETTKSTVASVTEEAQNLREPLKEAGQKLSQTARGMRETVRDQVQQTKSAVQDAGSDTSGSGSGSSLTGTGSGLTGMGMGGSELGSTGGTGLGSEMPDIRNTPLAESDQKLVGKDLTKDLDEE